MGLHLARTCRKLAVSDYVYTLSFISDALSKIGHFPMHYLPHLVDLAALVLREHPTRKYIPLLPACPPTHILVYRHPSSYTEVCGCLLENFLQSDPYFRLGPVFVSELPTVEGLRLRLRAQPTHYASY